MSIDDERPKRSGRGLARLYDEHAPVVLRFFQNKARAEDVEDLVQETMRRLFERVDDIDPDRSVRAYVYGIAHNVLREYVRKRAPHRSFEAEVALARVVPTAGSLAVRHQQMRLFLRGLREIPLGDQILLELYYFEAIKIKTIARDYLRIPESTARSRLETARHRLKQKIEGFEASAALIESTVEHLEDWAEDIRAVLGRLLEGLSEDVSCVAAQDVRLRRSQIEPQIR